MEGTLPRAFEGAVRRTPRADTVVVGLGNEIVRDDGVGIHVARRLAASLRGRPDVDVVELPWAGFALLDVIADRRRAVLIDCLSGGAHPPGTVVRLGEEDFAGSVRLHSFHDIDYPTVLSLGRAVGWRLPEDVAIWAVEGAVVDEFGETMTAPVREASSRVVAEVLAHLEAGR